nr:hypothetical protein [uncultured Sphaerochaeta sp.]
MAELDAGKKADKKKITALEKDKATLQTRIAWADDLVAEIGGQLTDKEAKRLILKKTLRYCQSRDGSISERGKASIDSGS